MDPQKYRIFCMIAGSAGSDSSVAQQPARIVRKIHAGSRLSTQTRALAHIKPNRRFTKGAVSLRGNPFLLVQWWIQVSYLYQHKSQHSGFYGSQFPIF